MNAEWTQALNLILGVPIFGVLLVLVMMKKVTPGWSLQQMEDQYEKRIADIKLAHERELASRDREIQVRDRRIDALLRDGEIAHHDIKELRDETYRDIAPILARATDSLQSTQAILRELAFRPGSRGGGHE